jgi:homoserine O-acetyltransferase/O-succinyltransferase
MTQKIRKLSPVDFVLLLSFLPSIGVAQNGVQQFAELGQCKLQSGKVIEHCRVGYRTFGALNAARDNTVVMATWLYGVSGDLAPFFGTQPSNQLLVDTSKFFGVALDAFGDGVSSSPSNSKTQPAVEFPQFTTGDMVQAQYRVLTEVLHLKHLHAVVGLSMGGEQTYMWASLHPEFFDLAVPIIATPRLTTYDLLTKQVMLETILGDPAYKNGKYTVEPELKLANLLGDLVVTSPAYRNQETPRMDFESFVKKSESPIAIDANDRVWQMRAVMAHDVIGSRPPEEVAKASPQHYLIIVSALDRMVNPQPSLAWAAAKGAPTYISQGTCAHIIMNCDAVAVSTRVRAFLSTGKLP